MHYPSGLALMNSQLNITQNEENLLISSIAICRLTKKLLGLKLKHASKIPFHLVFRHTKAFSWPNSAIMALALELFHLRSHKHKSSEGGGSETFA